MIEPKDRDNIRVAFGATINRFSRENVSNTQDFVLANFLLACLEAFEDSVNLRGKLSSGAAPAPALTEEEREAASKAIITLADYACDGAESAADRSVIDSAEATLNSLLARHPQPEQPSAAEVAMDNGNKDCIAAKADGPWLRETLAQVSRPIPTPPAPAATAEEWRSAVEWIDDTLDRSRSIDEADGKWTEAERTRVAWNTLRSALAQPRNDVDWSALAAAEERGDG